MPQEYKKPSNVKKLGVTLNPVKSEIKTMKFDEWLSADSPEKAEEYRRRFKMAIANSVRRKILLELDEGEKTADYLLSRLNVSEKILKYHLDTLEKGSCIEYDGEKIRLTEEGRVLARLVREKM